MNSAKIYTSNEINEIVDKAFAEAFSQWEQLIEKELYPAAFADQYSWLRVKGAISVNNVALKNAIKFSLSRLLAD